MDKLIILTVLFSLSITPNFAQENADGSLCDADKAQCLCDTTTHEFIQFQDDEGNENHVCLPLCPQGMERNYETRSCIAMCPEGSVRTEFGGGYSCQVCNPSLNEVVEGECLPKCNPGKVRHGKKCLPACPAGKERWGEMGKCTKICRGSQYRDEIGKCRDYTPCPYGMTRDEHGNCYRKCPVGYEEIGLECEKECNPGEERVGGKCLPKCPPRYKRNGQGICEYCAQ